MGPGTTYLAPQIPARGASKGRRLKEKRAETEEEKRGKLEQERKGGGVDDGARTRDSQNHNLELYHLSYIHRNPFRIARNRWFPAGQIVKKQQRFCAKCSNSARRFISL